MDEADGFDASAGAYERAREAILTGALLPGAAYTQAALTTRLGVGRTPLREAVRRLQSEGLLLQEPNRRLRITPLTPHDLSSLYAMRIALEPLAVRLTVPHLTEFDAATLTDAVVAMDAAAACGDFAGIVAPHRLFHQVLYSRAGERFVRGVQELRDQSDRYRRLIFGGVNDASAPIGGSRPGHAVIAEAAVARDADRCAELMAQHLARAALHIFAELEGTFEPASVRAALQFALLGTSAPSSGSTPHRQATRAVSRAGAAA